jgi:hypothetical protein
MGSCHYAVLQAPGNKAIPRPIYTQQYRGLFAIFEEESLADFTTQNLQKEHFTVLRRFKRRYLSSSIRRRPTNLILKSAALFGLKSTGEPHSFIWTL